jgi:hypothetical protein
MWRSRSYLVFLLAKNDKDIDDILKTRIKMPAAKWKQARRHQLEISAEEAIDFGLADEFPSGTDHCPISIISLMAEVLARAATQLRAAQNVESGKSEQTRSERKDAFESPCADYCPPCSSMLLAPLSLLWRSGSLASLGFCLRYSWRI